MLKDFFTQFNPGTRSLRTQLAVYFIPVSILPAIAISFYATRVFEETTHDSLIKRAASERDALVAEIDTFEKDLLNEARSHAAVPRLVAAAKKRDREAIANETSGLRPRLHVRLYTPDGQFIARRGDDNEDKQIPFIAKEALVRIRAQGEKIDRYFAPGGSGFITLIRVPIRDKQGLHAILEEEYNFSERELTELKNRRQVDVALLNRDFRFKGWSLAVPQEMISGFWSHMFQGSLIGNKDPVFVRLGDSRYAGFIYDLPMPLMKKRDWGYVAVFLPMASVDAMTLRLKTNMIFITAVLIWVFMLLIFFFSKKIVKPIELLVLAMKRVKVGKVEEIPHIDSTYEIEYLVQAFNEMTRNVMAAKRALEIKLEELHRANQEIKRTQSHLVQSAKMISLGQIVAGVAHELNNPIGFIHSNINHLGNYLDRFKKLVSAYRDLRTQLPENVRAQMAKTEADLEIDYILKDTEDLIRSVVDGANRTKDIVLGLRTFSRMDESVFKPENIHDGIRTTLKLLSAELKNKITLHEDYGELPLIECNLSQLNQVFMNLLTNAAHAIEGRGDIWIRTRLTGDQVKLEIEDTGSGIPAAIVEKIFDPFFTTKKVGQGTGLGLSIAYGLIEKHHGTIQVKSQVGKGTRFTITLPICQPVRATA